MNKIYFYRPSKPSPNFENDFDGSSLSSRSNNPQPSIQSEKNTLCLSSSIPNPNPVTNIESRTKFKTNLKIKIKTNKLSLKKKKWASTKE